MRKSQRLGWFVYYQRRTGDRDRAWFSTKPAAIRWQAAQTDTAWTYLEREGTS